MNIEELKRLAVAATPGPWAHGVTWIEHLGGIVALGNTARSKQDVAYVAAANPAAILELIQQRDELLAALKYARELVDDWGAYASNYMQEKHDLAGDLDRLDAHIKGGGTIMTTTAHEDQYTVAPEPVRQPYDTVAILRRNVADLELALRTQTELKEKAEAELARLREQKPVAWCDGDGDFYCGENYPNAWPTAVPLFAAPVPVPAVPELDPMTRLIVSDPKQLKPKKQEPAVSAANPVQWLEDEGDMILVPRGLLGAACSSIDKQRPAPKVLEAMRHYTMNAPQAPAVPTNTIPEGDDFNGTTPHMIRCIESLVAMNDRGALAPHGLCGHSRTLLLASANRLRQQQAHVVPAVPEEWRDVMQDAHDTFQRYADQHRAKDTRDSHEKANVNQKLANRLYALLQSAEVTK